MNKPHMQKSKPHDHLNRCRKNHLIKFYIHFSIIRTLTKELDIEGDRGNVSRHNKATYEKLTLNIICNSEKLKVFLLKSEVRQGCLLSSLLLISIELLVTAVRKKKK